MRARHRHFNPRTAGATLCLDSRFGFSQADGTAVSTWTSRTGSNDATQGTAANRPTFETNEVGGNPAVRFDGTDDFLAYSTSLFTYTGGATVLSVVKPTISASNEYGSVIAEQNGTNTSIGCQVNVFPNNAVEPCTDVFAPGGMRYNSTISNSTWHVVAWHWSNWSTHKSNGNTRIAVSGTEVSGTAYGANPSSFTSTRRAIGRFHDTTSLAPSFLQADMALVCALPECGAALRRRLYHNAAYSFKIACN